ncbi:MAG TPA: 1,4-dihydroxy-6-naphthoate synthase, partial [Verrucomicrobiae bacterium]|nr:1,4-dihydroxy-6-naphthoate synthase [Verrucomicrobiae bacterium]
LTLGFSSCPNDTFLFYALVHGLLAGSPPFRHRIEDVETLNRLVLARELDVSKVSCHLVGHVRDDYVLLRSGGALGRGCGPLVVAREGLAATDLHRKRVAVPGRYTTAWLLLRMFDPRIGEGVFMPFDRIMDSVASGETDAGLIIHESRFTYASHGLVSLLDLGEWWEGSTGMPLPLGGIVARRSLGEPLLRRLESLLRESVEYAWSRPGEAQPYIRRHSQEMSEETCQAHISLYVNDFSAEVGEEGERAMRLLLERGAEAGILPKSDAAIFIE